MTIDKNSKSKTTEHNHLFEELCCPNTEQALRDEKNKMINTDGTLYYVLAMIVCTVIANLFMKIGASAGDTSASGFLARLFSVRVLIGLGFFGTSAMIYLIILSRVPLSVAQSFAAAQFCAVILASWIILAEPIGPVQWLGMALIALGIGIVGLSR